MRRHNTTLTLFLTLVITLFTTCKKVDTVDTLWVNEWLTNFGTMKLSIKEDSKASYIKYSTSTTIVNQSSNGQGGANYYISTKDNEDGKTHNGKARIRNQKLYIGSKSFNINQTPKQDSNTGIITMILDGATYYALSSLPLPIKVGDNYGGGIIFHVEYEFGDRLIDAQHGLIVAPFDQSSATKWMDDSGIYDFYGQLKDPDLIKGSANLDGKNNTAAIINRFGDRAYAAKLCDELVIDVYDDWYLPSIKELELLYYNQPANIGIKKAEYWSSSYVMDQAKSIDFNDTYPFNNANKIGNVFSVRAIRSF